MKKFFILMAAAMMAIGASAQVVTSRTTFKSKSQTLWYVRAGMSINNMAGMGDLPDGVSMGSKIGADIDFGFQKNMGKSGLYWGMELGVGSRGFSVKADETAGVLAWNVKYSPFTFGYKYSVTDDLKLDAHLGIYASYDFTGSVKNMDDTHGYEMSWSDFKDAASYESFDAGMQVGIGAWWKKVNLDFTYQRGFVNALSINNKDLTSSNFMIRVGYAF